MKEYNDRVRFYFEDKYKTRLLGVPLYQTYAICRNLINECPYLS